MNTSLIKLLKAGHHVMVNGKIEDILSELPNMVTYFVPQPEEGSPRAMILCLTDDQVRSIETCLKEIAKELDLTIDILIEKGNKLKQRNDLFDGTEVIIGTVKRITELYFQNGFNMGKIKFVAILDADALMRMGMKGNLTRLAESLPKCRVLISALHTDEERLVDFQSQFFTPITEIELFPTT